MIGVTTAATLWFVTVMGLCFGGGQIGLGLTMLASGMLVLSVLKSVENRMDRDRRATLLLVAGDDGPTEQRIRDDLTAANFRILSCAVKYVSATRLRRLRCDLEWSAQLIDNRTPPIVETLAGIPGVVEVEWRP